MAESSISVNFDIQAQVLLGRSTRGTCRVLTALNVNFVVIKWSQNEGKYQLSPKTLSQRENVYLSSSSATLTWVLR